MPFLTDFHLPVSHQVSTFLDIKTDFKESLAQKAASEKCLSEMDKNEIQDIDNTLNFFQLKADYPEHGALESNLKPLCTCRSQGIFEEEDPDHSEGDLFAGMRPMDEQNIEQLEYSQCCGDDDEKDICGDSTVDGLSQKRSVRTIANFDDKMSLFSDRDQYDANFEIGSSLTIGSRQQSMVGPFDIYTDQPEQNEDQTTGF